MIHYFGVRHHSPNSAWQLIRFLEEKQPAAVLVEGPSDLTELGTSLASSDIVPPVALLVYTKTTPVRTILYPFAEYSPEYQAVLWAVRCNRTFAFIDLPSSTFLALQKETEEPELAAPTQRREENSQEDRLDSFWERNLEQQEDMEYYRQGAYEYGKQLRLLQNDTSEEAGRSRLRESYMCRRIAAVKKQYAKEDIVVVAGAFHIEGLIQGKVMTAAQEKKLPALPCISTLMPYSYYRLSQRSGYGAGNQAPAYYEMVWRSLKQGNPMEAVYEYLSTIAARERSGGNFASTAEVIEAVRLSMELARMKQSPYPILEDLRDSAITCMGQGQFSKLALACAATEIGTKIGEVKSGDFRTAIQDDFYRLLDEYKLQDYKTLETKFLSLDLRENIRVKSERLAWLDLNRSCFFNQLLTLGISFAKNQQKRQDNATWAESWSLQWTPEAEIQIAEASLKGDTIRQAAAFVLKEQLEQSSSVGMAARGIEQACECGMPEAIPGGVSVLQGLSQENVSVTEIAAALTPLSAIIRYGTIRHVDGTCLEPVVAQLFYRGCLLLPEASVCDDAMARTMTEAMTVFNEMTLYHDFVNTDRWTEALYELARRDDLNTELSGYAASILLERGLLREEELEEMLAMRLSKGMPAQLGAGWFAGFSRRNHYALFARISLWRYLSEYVAELEDEAFKTALVCLRRAFCDFTAAEKSRIAENLGEIWGISGEDTSEILNGEVSLQQEEMLTGLEDFDFGDFL